MATMIKSNVRTIKAGHIIIFDDDCILCHTLVHFIIKHDKEDRFVFASLQSKAGQKLKGKTGLPQNYSKSIILVDGETFYLRSTAVIKILYGLGRFFKISNAMLIIPAFIRDSAYNLIAKTRFRIFGKPGSCFLIMDDIRHKFL